MNRRDPVDGYEEHLEPVIRGARAARLNGEVAAKEGGEQDRQGVHGWGPRAKL